MGHYATTRPDLIVNSNANTNVQLLQATTVIVPVSASTASTAAPTTSSSVSMFTLAQTDDRYDLIPTTWFLLDSQSTVSVFHNSDYLSNIRRSPSSLKVVTNGGMQISSLIGDVTNFGSVWYNSSALQADLLNRR